MAQPLVIARHGTTDLALLPALANRHGLITGATGTGKTITLQVLAERFSSIGVPVFMADVKGDLSGLAKAGGANPKVAARMQQLKLTAESAACPVIFWDVYGKSGHPVRATVSDMGPLLLGRMRGLFLNVRPHRSRKVQSRARLAFTPRSAKSRSRSSLMVKSGVASIVSSR